MPPILVTAYDSTWPARFEQLCAHIRPVLSGIVVSIEHVGSTSVSGLAAKPIIDMSVVVADESAVALAIERLASLGYEHRGNLGIEGREAFHHPPDLPPHHLYVCPQGSLGLRNHLAVRDYLRSHPECVQEYARLKKRLADQFPKDIEAYIDGKTDFLMRILQSAGLTRDDLGAVEQSNRKP